MLNLQSGQNSQYGPHLCRCPKLRVIIAASVFLFSIDAYAHQSLPILSGSSGWEASLDNSTWVPAYGSYPNPISQPVVTTLDLDPARATLMWYWGEGIYTGIPDGKSGPNTVYFRYTFSLSGLVGSPVGAWVAADDWMRLTVNGHTEDAYVYNLADHTLPNGQPAPVFMSFFGHLNSLTFPPDPVFGDGTSQNVITIEAHDGGAVASPKVYEWVFFDAQHIVPGDAISFVPEPGSLALVVAGLGAIGTIRYRWRT